MRSNGSRCSSVGRFSYSLYLVHAPLILLAWMFVVEPLDLPSGAKLAVMIGMVVPLIVVVSYGFFMAVERPFLEHRSWRELRGSWARRRPAHLARPARRVSNEVRKTLKYDGHEKAAMLASLAEIARRRA